MNTHGLKISISGWGFSSAETFYSAWALRKRVFPGRGKTVMDKAHSDLNPSLPIRQCFEGPFQQEGYQLMAAVFEVHNELGGGLSEEIYQESLEYELSLRSIPFQPRQEIAVYYKNKELNKCYIPDLYVYDGVVVELKAVSRLLPEHEAQLFNYMRLTRKRVGYLINMAAIKKVEWRRYVL